MVFHFLLGADDHSAYMTHKTPTISGKQRTPSAVKINQRNLETEFDEAIWTQSSEGKTSFSFKIVLLFLKYAADKKLLPKLLTNYADENVYKEEQVYFLTSSDDEDSIDNERNVLPNPSRSTPENSRKKTKTDHVKHSKRTKKISETGLKSVTIHF